MIAHTERRKGSVAARQGRNKETGLSGTPGCSFCLGMKPKGVSLRVASQGHGLWGRVHVPDLRGWKDGGRTFKSPAEAPTQQRQRVHGSKADPDEGDLLIQPSSSDDPIL